MASRRINEPQGKQTRSRPATTPEEQEQEMISLAVDLAKKQLADGTASAQVVTHYLKMSSSREKLEQRRIEHDIKFMDKKMEQLDGYKQMEALYSEALNAMSVYKGEKPPQAFEHDNDYDD